MFMILLETCLEFNKFFIIGKIKYMFPVKQNETPAKKTPMNQLLNVAILSLLPSLSSQKVNPRNNESINGHALE
jgi:hypothetical protein